MSEKVNYIKFWSKANARFAENEDIRPTHIAMYNALFQMWNQSNFDNPMHCNRQDVMYLAKVASRTTYDLIMKDLVKWEFLEHTAYKNPLKASKFDMSKNWTSDCASSSSCAGRSAIQSTMQSTGPSLINKETLKPINLKTLKLIETNVSTLEENLENWLKGKFPVVKESPKKNVELFKSLRDMFFEWYETDKKRKYSFQAKCGKAIYAIIKKIAADLRSLNLEVTEKSILENWGAILSGLPNIHKNDQWIYQGVELSLINSKWNQVVTGIKKQNNGTELTYENIMREAHKVADANRSS